MKQKTAFLLPLLAAAILHAEMDVPEAGRIRIDGDLSDWRNADWMPIINVIAGSPTHVTNARWSLSWDEEGIVYVAVQYDDTNIVLRNNTNMCDCIELYVRGDTGSEPLDFYPTQASAQSYLIGLLDDPQTEWVQMGPFETLPPHNPIQAAITLDDTHFVYEVAVPLYDHFDSQDEKRSSKSDLFPKEEIGFDIAIVDVASNNTSGILGYNARKKRAGADQIAIQLLED